MKPIRVYTDGGTRNTGNKRGQHVKSYDKAAWAYAIVFPRYPGKFISNSKAGYGFTNNQMELSGVIAALNSLLINMPPSSIQRIPFLVISDSRYVVNAIKKKWLLKWKNEGFKGRKNAGYWKVLYILASRFRYLNFKWVKGHANCQGNIFVDHLLNKKMDQLPTKKPKHLLH